VPFILAGVFIFVPTVGLCILADSFYYGMEHFPVVTPYNFMKFNVVEGLSSMFGIKASTWYFTFALPEYIHVAYPFAVYAFVSAIWTGRNRHMALLVACYVGVFSALPHKEQRFL
jgi:phosphatidylinositol glycan class B